jgi:hypothetical protein
MILIEFYEGQGLGNQLWLYSAGRVLADIKNCDLYIENDFLFKGANFLNIRYKSTINFPKNFKKKLAVYNEPFFFDPNFKTYITFYDKNFFKINKNVILRGIFQSEKYLRNSFYKNENIISFKNTTIGNLENLNHKICLINLRGGEFKRYKDLILPLTYWNFAMKYMKERKNVSKFIIVTDDKFYARRLFPDFEIISDDISLCFRYLTLAKYLIVSNSSFSYFPISMNRNKPFVIAPHNWGRFNNRLNLWVAPCNFYKKWHWMDYKGRLFKHSELNKHITNTWLYYNTQFIPQNVWKVNKENFFNIYFLRFKRYLKKKISFFLPTLIG